MTPERLAAHVIANQCSSFLPEPEQHQTAQRNETSQYNTIPPLLRPNPLHQPIDAWDLGSSTRDPPLYTDQALPLYAKVLVHGVCLAQHAVRHVVAVVYAPSLVQHVVCLGCFSRAVGADVGADIGEEVRSVAGGADCGLESRKLGAVLL